MRSRPLRLSLLCVLLACAAFGKTHAENPTFVLSLSGERKLVSYSISSDGKLSRMTETSLEASPGNFCVDATGQHLYVAGSIPDSIHVLRSGRDGLRPLQSIPAPAKAAYLSVSPSGQFLLGAYYKTGQVTVHRIVGEGRTSTDPLQVLDVAPRAHCIVTDPSGRYAFVPHTSANRISLFKFDSTNGILSPNEPEALPRGEKTGPRHLWFHPSREYAFGSDEQGRSLSLYKLDEESGKLKILQTVSSVPSDYEGKGTTSHVESGPLGKHVYIANRGHGSIGVFKFNRKRESLTLQQHVEVAKNVRGFAVSSDGQFLVAAGQSSNQLICFRVGRDGNLTMTDKQSCGKTPWWLRFLPNQAAADGTLVDYDAIDRSLTLGQGTMAGEVTASSALLQTRLTKGSQLDRDGGIPGGDGIVRFQWSLDDDFSDAATTPFQVTGPLSDFIARAKIDGLKPGTRYFYRAHYGHTKETTKAGPTCSFKTLPGSDSERDVTFIVGSCMNYIKFMHGRRGNAGGPLTATPEDKRLGFPAFASMRSLHPEFFIGTGDIVYYDNPYRVARTVSQLRKCWQEQFRFPRMVQFFADVPTYWSKDDHDFRFNDSDNETNRIPLPKTGIDMFREQLPIAESGVFDTPNYRTFRVSKHLQIWLTEGRDHRSANNDPDGPEKTMWGKEQLQWLKTTLVESDATWKVMVNPTPMVGPDDAYKSDNHANLLGFRHEADAFFDWTRQKGIENLFLVCGDRHWQYHSIHPLGINEFACGALNDENSRMGVPPGADYGSDPDGKVKQPYTSSEPSGGFLRIEAGKRLRMTHFSDDGDQLYQAVFPSDVGGS